MSTAPTIPAVIPAASVPEPRADEEATPFSFTAEAFERMIDAGIFDDADRAELWDGQVCAKMAKTQAHASASINMTMTLVPLLPPGWCLSGENPIALGPKLTPLPDFAILRGRGQDYVSRRPTPDDVGLIVELAVTSLQADLGFRLANYAAAKLPVYWVLNLVDNVILVFERPVLAERRYEVAQTYRLDQSVPLRLDGIVVAEIPAVDLLPVRA